MAAAAASAAGHQPDLRGDAAAFRRGAGRCRRRPDLPRRAQRLRANRPCCASPPGWCSPMPASASPSPARRSAICRRNRICPASPRPWPMSRPGSDAAARRGSPPRAVSAQGTRPFRRGETPPRCPAARRAARRWPARWLRSPDILLLDEPTNHLDLPGIEWLERELAGMRAGIVLISHDRRLLERFSRSTVWLDRGITRTLDEGFAAFEAWRDAILEQEESEQHKLGRKIAMEEDWLRYGVTARRTRNQRRLAELHALRRQRREHRGAAGHGAARGGAGRVVGPAGRGGGRDRQILWRSRRSCGIFRCGSCAATGSASSARTAPARRRCSTC